MHHHKVNTVWTGDTAFDSHLGKHVVRIDGNPVAEDKTGTGPKALILTALTGCTGIDVVMLLQKMRAEYDKFEIEASATLTDEHPKTYPEIKLVYRFTGKELSEEKLRKAITLSIDRYCGVAAMLRAHCPILWELEMIETD